MPTKVEKDASPDQIRQARRLLDLKVKEVSVVDRPAIRREFLIVKRLEETDMPNKDESVTKAEMDAITAKLNKQFAASGWSMRKFDVEKGLPAELKSALEAVLPWMKKMAGQTEGDVKNAIMMVASYLNTLSEGSAPTPVAENEKKAEGEGGAPGAKKPGEDEEDDEEKKKKDPKKEDEEDMPEKQKALALDDDAAAVVKIDKQGNVHVVAKGQKKQDAQRVAGLSEASKKILSLLKEADPSAWEEVLEKELPAGHKFHSSVGAQGVGKPGSVKKNDETPEWAQDIQKRLDSIEKARPGSTALNEDGGSEKKEVKKGFWSGVV